MKLKSAKFQNYRCFSDFSIDLHPKLNVFVGENGAGKTAAIEGIVSALSMLNMSLGIGSDGPKNSDVKQTAQGGIESSGFATCVTSKDQELTVNFKPNLEKTEENQKIGIYQNTGSAFPGLGEEIARNPGSTQLLPVYAYYPASRHLTSMKSVSSDRNNSFGRLDSIKNAGSALTHHELIVDWLYDLYVSRLIAIDQNENDEISSTEQETVDRAIKQVIPEVTSISFTKKSPRKLLLKWDNNGKKEEKLVSQLSDGYRMMLALVIDFARRLAQANPQLPNPLESEAVLLIDEIDLHLHPAWQQRIITDLRKAFPNTQMIVATHSPQVISSVKPENVFVFSNGKYETAHGEHTYGVESYRVLEEIFGVSPAPEIEEIAILKKEYTAMIEASNGESPDAVEVRKKLESHLGEISPFMINARAEIARRKRKAS